MRRALVIISSPLRTGCGFLFTRVGELLPLPIGESGVGSAVSEISGIGVVMASRTIGAEARDDQAASNMERYGKPHLHHVEYKAN